MVPKYTTQIQWPRPLVGFNKTKEVAIMNVE